MTIENVAELEERLSRPSDAVVSAMKAIDGDFLILGAGGKMGPSLAKLARRAADKAGKPRRIVAVSRFTNPDLVAELSTHDVETIACDLLEPGSLSRLPDIANIIFMAARKFGTSGDEHLTRNDFITAASSHFLRGMCIRCVQWRRAGQWKRLRSIQLESTPNRRSAGNGCSNMHRRGGEHG
jgi:hypothetical protein